MDLSWPGFLAPGPLWTAAGMVLLVIEILAPGAFMMWLGLAAIGTGLLVHWTGLGLAPQVLVFALLAAIGIAAALRLRRARHPRRPQHPAIRPARPLRPRARLRRPRGPRPRR